MSGRPPNFFRNNFQPPINNTVNFGSSVDRNRPQLRAASSANHNYNVRNANRNNFQFENAETFTNSSSFVSPRFDANVSFNSPEMNLTKNNISKYIPQHPVNRPHSLPTNINVNRSCEAPQALRPPPPPPTLMPYNRFNTPCINTPQSNSFQNVSFSPTESVLSTAPQHPSISYSNSDFRAKTSTSNTLSLNNSIHKVFPSSTIPANVSNLSVTSGNLPHNLTNSSTYRTDSSIIARNNLHENAIRANTFHPDSHNIAPVSCLNRNLIRPVWPIQLPSPRIPPPSVPCVPCPSVLHLPPPSLPQTPLLTAPSNALFNLFTSQIGNNECSVLKPLSNVVEAPTCNKLSNLVTFLQNFSADSPKESKKFQIAIPKFRSALMKALKLFKQLKEQKIILSNLLEAGEDRWNAEIEKIESLKSKLSDVCCFASYPKHLNAILKKLQIVKRKRQQKRKRKLYKIDEKLKNEQRKEELGHRIDRWLDNIKEKNLKEKREAEMKKEADYVLHDVRKKIHEANRTIEKINVLEKLRNVRQMNAMKKGLHIMAEHTKHFEEKMYLLKRTMQRQLADYEAEENALKVMLENEQEGQLEEEIQKKIQKAKTLQRKRQKNIIECLFGNSDDPEPTDQLYLFNQFQTRANSSIEILTNIRHQWDLHLSEDGESIPQQWVVPTSASDGAWENALVTTPGALKLRYVPN